MYLRLPFLLFLLSAMHPLANAQWKPVATPPAAYASYVATAKNDSIVLATNEPSAQFFYTGNGGQSWTNFSNPSYSDFYPALIHKGDIYAFNSTKGIGVYSDGQWSLRNNGLAQSSFGYLIYSMDTDGKQLLVSGVRGSQNTLFLSGDGGLNWQPVGRSGLSTAYNALWGYFVGKNIYSQGITANNGEAYFSPDGGDSWQKLPLKTGNTLNKITFSNDRKIVLCAGQNQYFLHRNDSLIATSGLPTDTDETPYLFHHQQKAIVATRTYGGPNPYDFHRSLDGGLTWTPFANIPSNLISMVAQNDTLAYTTADGLFWSTDFGDTWTPLGLSGLDKNILVNAVLLLAKGKLYLSGIGDAGFAQYDPSSNSWKPLNNGLQKTSAYFVELYQDAAVWLVASWNGSFASADKGQNWTNLNQLLWFFQKLGNHFFATDGLNLWQSQNGTLWEKAANVPNLWVLWRAENKLIGFNDTKLYASDAQGSNWQLLNDSLPFYPNDLAIDGARWYFAVSDGVYLSEDEGQSFTKIRDLNQPQTLLFNKGRLLAGLFNGGVSYTDDGTTWKLGTGSLSVGFDFTVGLSETNGFLLAAGKNSQVRISANNGNSWTPFNTGLPANHNCAQVLRLGDKLYAACDRGLYERPLADLPSVPTQEVVPDLYTFAPNPTQNWIYFDAPPLSKNLKISILDVQGRTVHERVLPAGQQALDLSALSPGIYLLKTFDGEKWGMGKLVKQ